MDFQWVAIELGDVSWIALAFGLGLVAQQVGLPPLVGYLAAGCVLGAQGVNGGALIDKLSDLGITLLLFTVGLKIHLRTLTRPQVWAVSTLHMAAIVTVFGAALLALGGIGWGPSGKDGAATALLLAFALSFSSTVFAVKALEARGELNALHGQVAIGILVMQDIAAVLFLAISAGKLPSLYAPALLLLLPARRLLHALLARVGHGELLILYGFLMALGGAELFELVQLKGDLGALVLGVLIANHPKSDELAKRMLAFKDLFLIAFFLSIGLAGGLDAGTVLTGFRLRARTALLTSLNLANYSEFGLIVVAIGAAGGFVDRDWLVIVSVALSLSFAIAAALNARSHWLYTHYRDAWRRWQSPHRLRDDRLLDIGNARIAIIGMGGVGTGAYDAGDADFWDRVQANHRLEQVLLTLPKPATSVTVLRRLSEIGFEGRAAAIAKFPDEEKALRDVGADTVYNIYAEAGAAFAAQQRADPLRQAGLKVRCQRTLPRRR